MFIIVNQTNTNVLFSDLKKVPPLKSGKAIDLDKLLPREETDRSKDLKDAIKNKIIKVIVKDKDGVEKQEEPSNKNILDDPNTKNIIQEEVSRQIKELLSNTSNNDNSQNGQEILNAIQNLSKKLEHGTKDNTKSEKENQYIDTEADESKIIDIHAKSMSRLFKKSKDDSNTFKTDVVKSKVDKNDLDDLAKLI